MVTTPGKRGLRRFPAGRNDAQFDALESWQSRGCASPTSSPVAPVAPDLTVTPSGVTLGANAGQARWPARLGCQAGAHSELLICEPGLYAALRRRIKFE